jgi:ribosomal protein S18 acetylase RimI-like enzyme
VSAEVMELDGSKLTEADVEQLGQLLRELSSSAKIPTRQELEQILSDPDIVVYVARLEGRIVGTLTLVLYRLLTGYRAHIEDVVTSTSVRRQGLGRLLTRAAVERARREGARTIDLTSRPSRVAANQLYVSEGFVLRETNVYRLTNDVQLPEAAQPLTVTHA